MYGFIHCCLEDLVMQFFGEEKWKEILEKSNLHLDEGSSFLIHRIYTDEETLQLVGATCQVLGLDLDTCLETFGEHFLRYCQGSGFDRLLRVLGGNLEDFLTSLDFLHEHLGSIYPGMHAPSFRCTHGENGVLMLHYYSDRKGLQSIVKGLVKIVSREFFDADVIIIIEEAGSMGEHIVFKVSTKETETTSKKIPKLIRESVDSSSPEDLFMNVPTFCQTFPFHMVFDTNFVITQVGISLRRLLRHIWTSGEKDFRKLFRFTRPVVESTFMAIVDHQNATFVVQTLSGILKPNDETAVLKLKGQMIPVPESSSMLFICSPRVSGPDEMQTLGLFLSDFRVHDFTRDLVLMRNAHRGKRELMQRLEETTNQLKIADAQLLADKERTEELLHSILPSKVAVRLALNLPVPAEVFDVVTVLFSDIVGFTAMCSDERVKPIDIVQVLDKMYTLFDMLSEHYKLYKVETIGDAYMVVGGIPEFVETHADQVVAMGLGMVEVIKQVLSPIDQQPLKMRVGVHTGSVLAGVVGQQMPRYCLFGNTVTLGNKMESNSLPGRVNVSEETISHLTSKTQYTFEDHPVPNFALKCSLVIPPPDRDVVEPNLLLKMEAMVSTISQQTHCPPQTAQPIPSEKDHVKTIASSDSSRNTNVRHVAFHPDMEPLPLFCRIPHSPSHLASQNVKSISTDHDSTMGLAMDSPVDSFSKASNEIPVVVIHPPSNTEEPSSQAANIDRKSHQAHHASLPPSTTFPPPSYDGVMRPKTLSAVRGILPFLGLALCSHYRRPTNPSATDWLERLARKQEEAARKLSQEQAKVAATPTTVALDPEAHVPEDVDDIESRKEEGSSVAMTTRSSFLCRARSFGDSSDGGKVQNVTVLSRLAKNAAQKVDYKEANKERGSSSPISDSEICKDRGDVSPSS